MSISKEPLGYCSNVHPGRSVAEVLDGLDRYTVPVQQRLNRPIAAGLWLAQPVVAEMLGDQDGINRFADELRRRDLVCYTLNAFPYGDFHSNRVKEKVYQPDWTTKQRLEYTKNCASVLAKLLPPDAEGSISTLPLGFKSLVTSGNFFDSCIEQLLECSRFFSELHEQSGKLIRLAIEPEPLCMLETTAEAIVFFNHLFHAAERAEIGEVARRHLGICYDICHQAVEFEDPAECVVAFDQAGIRINKVHISCALQLDSPAKNEAGRAALKNFIEPRYLHQVIARSANGQLHRWTDLDQTLIESPSEEFQESPSWRIHFHVPISAKNMGDLATTHSSLQPALQAIAKLNYAPHLEVETYTWNVLPGAKLDLIEGLAKELDEAQHILQGIVNER